MRVVARLCTILLTLARHDCLFVLEDMKWLKALLWPWRRRSSESHEGKRLAEALQGLGPLGIKLGQALSVRPDLVGRERAEGLRVLQDKLPPFSLREARTAIEQEFSQPLESLYKHFEPTPVAAASIAQVHKAETLDGQAVAVKVLRPNIEHQFQREIRVLSTLARWLQRWCPGMRRLRPVEVVATLDRWVTSELNLLLEAASCDKLGSNLQDEQGFRVPAVDWRRSGRRVLTLAWVDGVRVDDSTQLDAWGIDRRALLERAARAFFLQVFRDGFFHADLHPGNLFVTADGSLVAVDFGITGHLDRQARFFLADILTGFIRRDYDSIARVHFDYGVMGEGVSRDKFALALRAIGESLFAHDPARMSIGNLLGRLFEVTEQFQMQVQPQLLLIQKTIIMAEGMGRFLDDSVNMWMLAEPLILRWMEANRGPEARILNALEDLPRVLKGMAVFLKTLENSSPKG